MSEQTVTTTIGVKPDPSLPTYCDHGVSLDDDCVVCKSPDAHIAWLEDRVVEAAVKLAQTSDHIDDRDKWEANEDALLVSARALIAAREKAERPIKKP